MTIWVHGRGRLRHDAVLARLRIRRVASRQQAANPHLAIEALRTLDDVVLGTDRSVRAVVAAPASARSADLADVALDAPPGWARHGRTAASAPVVAQAWRGSARQARLARLLTMIDVRDSRLTDARAAGELLAATGTSEVVDALVALLAVPGDQLLTSDPDDLKLLVDGRGLPMTVVSM
jgi:hypothetical protein